MPGRVMSHNSFGHLFRVTTFGESHGVAIGCIVDGTPPGLTFTPVSYTHLTLPTTPYV